jgi:hypothetical protein
MITAFILIIVSFVALIFLSWLAKGNSVRLDPATLAENIRPVDIIAFSNLVDPREEAFLRANLRPADFRAIHRERLLAAVDYVSGALHNTAVLVRMGEMARRSPDPAIAHAGEKLVTNAIQLRLYSFQAMAKLYIAILLPQVQVGAGRLPDNYESVTRQVSLLGGLRFPTNGVASAL